MCNPNVALASRKPKVVAREQVPLAQNITLPTPSPPTNPTGGGLPASSTTEIACQVLRSLFSKHPTSTDASHPVGSSIAVPANGAAAAFPSFGHGGICFIPAIVSPVDHAGNAVNPSLPAAATTATAASAGAATATTTLAFPDVKATWSYSAIPSGPVTIGSDATVQAVVPVEKTKPKRRRRKPQKPGKTAKNQERHFVVHNYTDRADAVDMDAHEKSSKNRSGSSTSFPMKLHSVLEQVEQAGYTHIVSWQPHGRCFVIHKPKQFVSEVMPKYFRQTKLTSFQRQLNLYGFNRITRGPDEGGYYNEYFLRGKAFLCKNMMRTKVKGTRFKAASSPELEPNFYTMKPIAVRAPTPPALPVKLTPIAEDPSASAAQPKFVLTIPNTQGHGSTAHTVTPHPSLNSLLLTAHPSLGNGHHQQYTLATPSIATSDPNIAFTSLAHQASPAENANQVHLSIDANATASNSQPAAHSNAFLNQTFALPSVSSVAFLQQPAAQPAMHHHVYQPAATATFADAMDPPVEDMFNQEDGHDDEEHILDFVNTWHTGKHEEHEMEVPECADNVNDSQMGDMLDQLLAEV